MLKRTCHGGQIQKSGRRGAPHKGPGPGGQVIIITRTIPQIVSSVLPTA